jgi:DDE superfamily endonuclease
MAVITTRRAARRATGRPLKSPLAVASGYPAPGPAPDSAAATPAARPELPPRELQLTEFADHLRTINNRDGHPYEESTISTYVYPAKALDRWITAKEIDGDFTGVDTAMLNRYFRDYYNEHGQDGTNAQQRNLLQLFRFLQSEYGHPHPYTEKLNCYAEVKGKRKNSWSLAEFAGDTSPDGMQRLLNFSPWDQDACRDAVTRYVVANLGDPGAVLIVDETGFLKKGTMSAGVARMYTGTAGRVENCQAGVFLAYAAPDGSRALVDRELYLPQKWAGDRDRCRAAGIGDEVGFATKPQLAQKMIERAVAAGWRNTWL